MRDFTLHVSHLSFVNCKKTPNYTEYVYMEPWGNRQVVCDVLNALGAGFSLKFIDLFLKACAVLAQSR